MAADHAERGAGRVEQDAIERHAVPPGRRRGRIAATSSACKPPRCKFSRTRMQPLRIDVDRHQLARSGSRSAMSAVFPPGAAQASSTRWPGGQPQGKRHALRAQILHGHHALGESGQLVHIAGRIEHHRVGHARFGARADAGRRAASPDSLRRCVRRLSTRSHIGACVSPAASSWVHRTGQSARRRSASQIGEAWRVAGLRAISASMALRSRK